MALSLEDIQIAYRKFDSSASDAETYMKLINSKRCCLSNKLTRIYYFRKLDETLRSLKKSYDIISMIPPSLMGEAIIEIINNYKKTYNDILRKYTNINNIYFSINLD
jgi:hypothetical protein